jgi:environmental stress-induced protein Ves
MTGLPEFNYPAFRAAAEELRMGGHTVFNPAEWWRGPMEDFPARRAFARYAQFICLEADTIVMLPGWENSLGATAELTLALNCQLDVFEWRDSV